MAILGVAYYFLAPLIDLDQLIAIEDRLRKSVDEEPWLTAAGCFLLYAVVTGLSIPGAALLTLMIAWLLGFWYGLLLVSLASTTGATLSFLLSRFLLRSLLEQKFKSQLERFQKAFAEDGPYYLFTLRLIPAVPFWLVNLLMGLTKIRVTTYWWVSQLGMLPGTIAYVWAGSTLPNLSSLKENGVGAIISWQLILAFSLLGVLPIAIRWVLSRFAYATHKRS